MNDQNQSIFREAMEKAMFKTESEKTRFDKLMGREEMLRLKQLFSKPILELEDVNEVQNIMVSSDIKLTDFQQNERYINHKYYIAIGMYVSRYCNAIRADRQYQEMASTKPEPDSIEEPEKETNRFFPKNKKKALKLPDNVITVRAEIQKDYASTYKELVNVYLFGVRSPLSSGGNLVKLLGTERKEVMYEGNLSPVPQQQQQRMVE
jgi:hypothetical protein